MAPLKNKRKKGKSPLSIDIDQAVSSIVNDTLKDLLGASVNNPSSNHSATAAAGFPAAFLDATLHLYKRSCPSVRPSVRRSVRPSVRPSVRRSDGPALFSNDEKCHFRSSYDIQIQYGVRKSQKESSDDIKM